METKCVQTKSHVDERAPSPNKDKAKSRCNEEEDVLLTLGLATDEGNIPELMKKILEQIIKMHPSLSLIELISAFQKAKPVHAAASVLKEPLKKMASEEGNGHLLDTTVEELVTKLSIAPIEMISVLQKAKPAPAGSLKEPSEKMASEEGNRHLLDLLDKTVEELMAKHPSVALIELISSLQKAKPIHAAACVVRGLIKTPETNTTIWYND